MKKNSVLAMLLIVLMCVSLVFTGCQGSGDNGGNDADKGSENGGKTFDDPNDQVAYAIDKTMSAMIDTDAIGSVLTEAVDGGKITIEVADMIENVLYMNVKGNQYADILTIGQSGVYTEIGVYLMDGQLAVSAPVLLGNEVYGIDFNTLENDLKNCELWELMGTSYEEFQSQLGIDVEALMDAVEKYMDAVADMGDSLEDCLKDVDVTREEGTATINGETVDAVNVKYHMTSDDVLALLNAYLDEVENSMDAMEEAFGGMLSFRNDMDFDSLRQEMADAFETVDLQGDLIIAINPKTQCIMSASLDITGAVDGEEGKIDMDLVLGVDPANSDKYSLTMYVEADGERNGITADVVFASKGSVDTTTLTISEVYDDEATTLLSGKLTYDSSNGEYDVAMNVDGQVVGMAGVYKVTADKFEFSVDTVTSGYEGDEYTETIDLRMCIETISKSEMPKMPNMKNILKLTQDEWKELLGKFGAAEPDDPYMDDYYDEDIYFDEDLYIDEDIYIDEEFYYGDYAA